MTEDEAKTKWCPFARVASEGLTRSTPLVGWNRKEGESFGHRQKIGGENHCIGSACMAWRCTIALRAFDRVTGARLDRPDAIATKHDEFRREVTGGYCGLAGAPQ